MAAGPFRLSYPFTSEAQAALARFPEVAKVFAIPTAGRSELEVVRLLGNTHYPSVDGLLGFIERELPGSGEIGARAVKSVDPFALREALAEFFLFAHLRRYLGSGVQPAAAPLKSDKRPEIDLTWGSLAVKFEVYSPLDLVGFQLLEEHLPALFKYLDVNRGFLVEVTVYPVDTSREGVWYPYSLPGQQDVLAWLEELGRTAHGFLGRPAVSPGENVRIPGPGGTTTLRLKVRGVFDDPAVRRVIVSRGGHSTDARLIFECGTADNTAQSRWGRKVQDKMRQRQAGAAASGLLRIFIVNFAQADTGWPDFFTWPDIAQRIDDTVRLIAGKLTSGLPYDVVIPARLDVDPCFGQAVWLNTAMETDGRAFVGAAQLDRPGIAPRTSPALTAAELDELVEPIHDPDDEA